MRKFSLLWAFALALPLSAATITTSVDGTQILGPSGSRVGLNADGSATIQTAAGAAIQAYSADTYVNGSLIFSAIAAPGLSGSGQRKTYFDGTATYVSINGGAYAAAGTVTSVALTLPSIFAVTGSPVAGSGTLAATLASQPANSVWGNFTGSSAAPTFSSTPTFSGVNITNLDATKLINTVPVAVIPARSAVYDFTRSTAPSGATGGSGAWAWTLPTGCVTARLYVVASGSGGGSGRRGATATTRCGGGGGGSGSVTVIDLPSSSLGSSLAITVGAGGAGGAAASADDVNGNAGGEGNNSSVAGTITILASQTSGGGGPGGAATTSGSSGNNNVGAMYSGQVSTGTTAGNGSNVQLVTNGSWSMPGAQGGGISSANVVGTGGPVFVGGLATNLGGNSSGVGIGSSAPQATTVIVGYSGGGGSANASAAAQAGGNGWRGSGGGGGGASLNGNASGAGGNGGDGFVRIICFF